MTANEPLVYVVDDDAGARQSLTWLIQSAGLRVCGCASASEFLEQLSDEEVGCLVLDSRMPGMSGIELLEKLQQDGRDVPTVFITGHGEVRTCARAFRAGVIDFLEKPVPDDVLLSRIHAGIARRREVRQANQIRRRYQTLTSREREVMHLILNGRRLKEVAATLQISLQTAAKHRTRILEKLKVENDVELAHLAHRIELVVSG